MNSYANVLRCMVITLTLLAAPTSWGDDWLYTVRPGDKLWDIALDYCGSGRFAQEIADHNGFTNSAQLQAGQRIAIPTSLLAFSPSNATIVQVSGNIVLLQNNGSQAPAQTGDAVNMGDYVISTDGAALVGFADGSQISIAPNSRVLFNKLTAFGPAGMVDTHLRFTYGQGEATVKPQNRGDRFRIQTPEGIAAVRGTQFRVRRSNPDEGPRVSTTETLEGLVAYSRQGQSTDVPAGFGVAASASGVVKEALLAAPVLNELPEQVTPATAVSWQALTGAQDYVVEWARQSQPDIVYTSIATRETQTQPPQTPGAYLLTVRGVSSSRIQGNNARQAVSVLNPAPTDLTEIIGVDGQITLQWQQTTAAEGYSIVAAADHWQTEETWESSTTSYPIELSAGNYRWYVTSSNGAASATQKFTVFPASPRISKVTRKKLTVSLQIEPAIEGVRYRIDLFDSSGALLQQQHSQGDAAIELPDFGRYQLQVASEQNSLHSEPVITPIEAQPKPWWLAIFLPLLAI